MQNPRCLNFSLGGDFAPVYPHEGTLPAYPANTTASSTAYQPPPFTPSNPEGGTTVIVTQPPVSHDVVYTTDRSRNLGLTATIVSVFTTVFVCLCGCWWTLPCAFAAIVFAIAVSLSFLQTTIDQHAFSNILQLSKSLVSLTAIPSSPSGIFF